MSNYEEMLKGTFSLEIKNFAKWNPSMKNKEGRRNWFKMDVHFWDDPKIRTLNDTSALIYLRLLSVRARSSLDLRFITARKCSKIARVPLYKCTGALVKLLKSGLIEIEHHSPEREEREKERKKDSVKAASPPHSPSAQREVLRHGLPEYDQQPLPDMETTSPQPVSKAPAKNSSLSEKQRLGMAVDHAMGVYILAWQKRYETQEVPDVGGKSRGILARMIKDHGRQRVEDLLQVYCQHREKWFEKMGHSLVAFERAFNQLAISLGKGDDSSTSWSKIFGEGKLLDGKRSLPKPN